jgi:hypothetical protein
MDPREARLHGMLKDTEKLWNLNEEDKEAIKWVMDLVSNLRDQLSESRSRELKLIGSLAANNRAVEEIADRLTKLIK